MIKSQALVPVATPVAVFVNYEEILLTEKVEWNSGTYDIIKNIYKLKHRMI